MRMRDTLTIAATALLRNRLRSLLTTLGVIIGVAAVIVMQGLGAGATALVQGEISSLGSNMMMLMPGTQQRQPFGGGLLSAPGFLLDDAHAIAQTCPAVRHITPYTTLAAAVVVGEENRTSNVFGVWPSYFEIRDWPIARGRLLDRSDEQQVAKRCVLGHTVVADLYGSQDPIGQELRVGDLSCEVVGVLEEKGVSTFGVDQDDVVFLPYSTFSRRLSKVDRVPMLMIAARSEDRIEEALEQVRGLMRERRHLREGEEDNFTVRDMREVQALLGTVTGVLSSLLAGVAAISLLVGGIGIMNIMLVSVTERTREIGIRLAVGARRRDISQQFLVEAVTLSATGGFIGVALGVLGIVVGSRAVHVPFAVDLPSVGLAFGFSLVVGVLFGGIPARKASRLRPIDALRSE